ncbi:hypothetical protein HAZT_HAZT012229 [Hyalella azteca]|uniref:C2H2-type domain-containing protein n=1 Tax=Hyalella azteca TaxID=294128 RepID=A0A6A0H9I8_HYAAZ|nr:hypothetical protein HAZT_HAZT012229 [Hyalella azteca]
MYCVAGASSSERLKRLGTGASPPQSRPHVFPLSPSEPQQRGATVGGGVRRSSSGSGGQYQSGTDEEAGGIVQRRTGDEVQCTYCGRVLCNKYVLKVHVRDMHTPRSSHECPHCRRCYSTLNSLRVHISTLHNRPPSHLASATRAPDVDMNNAPMSQQQQQPYYCSNSYRQQFFSQLQASCPMDTPLSPKTEFCDPNMRP